MLEIEVLSVFKEAAKQMHSKIDLKMIYLLLRCFQAKGDALIEDIRLMHTTTGAVTAYLGKRLNLIEHYTDQGLGSLNCYWPSPKAMGLKRQLLQIIPSCKISRLQLVIQCAVLKHNLGYRDLMIIFECMKARQGGYLKNRFKMSNTRLYDATIKLRNKGFLNVFTNSPKVYVATDQSKMFLLNNVNDQIERIRRLAELPN